MIKLDIERRRQKITKTEKRKERKRDCKRHIERKENEGNAIAKELQENMDKGQGRLKGGQEEGKEGGFGFRSPGEASGVRALSAQPSKLRRKPPPGA